MVHHPSFGAALAWDVAGGTSYTAIGQVKDIGGLSLTRDSTEVSDHDSADGWKEFLGGMTDGGAISFTVGYDNANAQHAALVTSMTTSTCTMPAWQLTLNVCSGTAIWTCDAFVTGMNFSAPVVGENTIDITIKVTAKPTLTVS